MATAPTSEEQLFRQFRRNGIPVWLERNRGVLWLLVIGCAVAAGSWAALSYLPSLTGQKLASVESWETRIEEAKPEELAPVFQSLFQVENDRVIQLGINYMLSADTNKRMAASQALEKSVKQWQGWNREPATKQAERVSEALAQHVRLFNLPEQVVAVEVVRQFLLWPTADDRDSHRRLLEHSEKVFQDAQLAFTDEPVSPAAALTTEETLTAAEWVARSLLDEQPETFLPSADSDRSPFFAAGFRRGPTESLPTQTVSTRRPPGEASNRNESQVPLVNGDGQQLGLRTVDPSTMSLPGGLIPVPLSGERKATPRAEGPNALQGPSMPRDSLSEVLQQRNQAVDPLVPGSSPAVPSTEATMLPGNPLSSPSPPAENSETPTNAPARLRDLEQRPDLNARSLEETRPAEKAIVQQIPDRLPAAQSWQPPNKPFHRWAHIDVMHLLQASDLKEVERAERELQRRGFSNQFIAAAYRLTSPDPLERYDLVFQLQRMSSVTPDPFLKWLSVDPHPEVRQAAVEQLKRLNGDQRF